MKMETTRKALSLSELEAIDLCLYPITPKWTYTVSNKGIFLYPIILKQIYNLSYKHGPMPIAHHT